MEQEGSGFEHCGLALEVFDVSIYPVTGRYQMICLKSVEMNGEIKMADTPSEMELIIVRQPLLLSYFLYMTRLRSQSSKNLNSLGWVPHCGRHR